MARKQGGVVVLRGRGHVLRSVVVVFVVVVVVVVVVFDSFVVGRFDLDIHWHRSAYLT